MAVPGTPTEEHILLLERLRLLRQTRPLLTGLEEAVRRGDATAALQTVRDLQRILESF